MRKLILLSLFIPLVSFGQSAQYYFEKANEELGNQNPFVAVELYTKAIVIDSAFADAYLNRGIAKALIDPKLFGQIYEDKTSACKDFYKAKRLGKEGSAAAKHSTEMIMALCADFQ